MVAVLCVALVVAFMCVKGLGGISWFIFSIVCFIFRSISAVETSEHCGDFECEDFLMKLQFWKETGNSSAVHILVEFWKTVKLIQKAPINSRTSNDL